MEGPCPQSPMADRTKNRNRKRNGDGPSNPPIPEELDLTRLLDALVKRIEKALNNVGNKHNKHAPPTPPPRKIGDKLLEHFHALLPKKFDGMMEP